MMSIFLTVNSKQLIRITMAVIFNAVDPRSLTLKNFLIKIK